MQPSIRPATSEDAPAILALLCELASAEHEIIHLTEAYLADFLASPGCGVLLAEVHGRPAGVLSYVIRPDLYHAGPTALIQELIVTAAMRGQGIGSALLAAFLPHMQAAGMMEVSVATMPGNQGAIDLYRRHGLVDEAVLLERHF